MENIFKTIEGMRDYILDLQRNMTRLPAVSPNNGGKGEFKKAQYLEAELKKLKFDDIKRIDVPDTRAEGGVRPNFIARYYGENKNRTLWLLAHMDIVSEGDRAAWKTDPFEMTIDADGDTMYGRGVEDNHQAIVAALMTAKAFMEHGKRPPVNLGIMLVADEEEGDEYGMKYLVKNHGDLFGKGDSFIVQDGGDHEGKLIEIAEKNVLWLKLTTTGAQAHGSLPNEGNNAFTAGCKLTLALRDGLYARFNNTDETFAPSISTFEPTKKLANVDSVNIIPGKDVFYMDCRILPCYDNKDVKDEALKIAARIAAETKTKVEVEVEVEKSSKATPADSPLVKTYAEATEKINGVKAKVIGIGGGTFAATVRNLGLPAVVATRIYENPHVPNEKASIKFTISDAKVLAYILANFK